MKKILILMIWSLGSYGQVAKKIRKVVPILSQESHYLNGSVRSSIGGKSKSTFKITLPKNTVEWYYVFTTTEANQGSKVALNLISQLTRYYDPTGLTATLANSIISPPGSSVCDVYVLDKKGEADFMAKTNFLESSKFARFIDFSREGIKNGHIQVKGLKNSIYYIGVNNPSTAFGINFNIEAAAIVEETIIDNTMWAASTKASLEGEFLKTLNSFENEMAVSISNCMVAEITERHNPETLEKLTQNEKKVYFESLKKQCTEQNTHTKSTNQIKALSYTELGMAAFEAKDLDKSKTYLLKSTELDSTNGVVKAHLGLIYLLQNEEAKGTEYYIDALVEYKKNNATKDNYIKEDLKKIAEAMSAQSQIDGAENIKALFESELKRNQQ